MLSGKQLVQAQGSPAWLTPTQAAGEEAHMLCGDSSVAARRDDGTAGWEILSEQNGEKLSKQGSCTSASSAQEALLGVAW